MNIKMTLRDVSVLPTKLYSQWWLQKWQWGEEREVERESFIRMPNKLMNKTSSRFAVHIWKINPLAHVKARKAMVTITVSNRATFSFASNFVSLSRNFRFYIFIIGFASFYKHKNSFSLAILSIFISFIIFFVFFFAAIM